MCEYQVLYSIIHLNIEYLLSVSNVAGPIWGWAYVISLTLHNKVGTIVSLL